MNELIKKLIPDLKKYWFIPVMILAGIFLMIRQADQPKVIEVSAISEDDRFIDETEKQIKEMLKGIDGAGECLVTITLSSGGRKEYVREDGSVLIITDKEGNQSAVIAREKAPEIAGVTIASKGAGSLRVRNDIIESVSTVLGIGTNKICVVTISG